MNPINVKISPAFVHKFPKAYVEETTLSYNPPLSSVTKNVDLGLTPEEVDKLFPLLLNESASNPNFYQMVRAYSIDLDWKIPYNGKIINVKFDKDGNPDNVLDYILYKTALVDDTVASKEVDFPFVDGKTFRYKMEDFGVLLKKEADSHKSNTSALIIYAKLVNTQEGDTSKLPLIKQILSVNRGILSLATDEIADMTKVKAEQQLKVLLDKHPANLIEADAKKDDLYILASIELALSYNIVNLEGDDVYLDGQKIASSKQSLLVVLRNQSDIYSKMQSKLRAASALVSKIVPPTTNESK